MPEFTWEQAKAWATANPDDVDIEKLKAMFPKESASLVETVKRVELSIPSVQPDITKVTIPVIPKEKVVAPATIESQTELLQAVSEIERKRISRKRSGRKFFDKVARIPESISEIASAVPALGGVALTSVMRNIARVSGGDEEKFAGEQLEIAGRPFPSIAQVAQQTVEEFPKTFLGGVIDVPFGETTVGDVAFNVSENIPQAFLDVTVARWGLGKTVQTIARPLAKAHLRTDLSRAAKGALTDIENIFSQSSTSGQLLKRQLALEEQFGKMTPAEITTRAGEQINKANLWQHYFADPAYRLGGNMLARISPEPVKRLFLTQYGVDPDYLSFARGVQSQIGINAREGVDWASATRPFTTEAERNAMLRMITDPKRGGGKFFSPERGLQGEPLKYANYISDKMTSLGKRAVDVGILGQESFDFFTGRYLPKLNQEGFGGWWERLKFKNQFSGRMKHRGAEKEIDLSDLPKWEDQGWEWFKGDGPNVKIRKFVPYGDVRDPFTLYAKGVADLEGDIGLGRIINKVLDNPIWTKDVATEGYVQLKTLRSPFNNIKKAHGKYVQGDIARDLNSLVAERPAWIRNYNKMLSTWKVFKTAFSPPTHMRNLFSNVVLADMGGLSAFRRPDIFKTALSDLKNQGKWYKEAEAGGLMGKEFYSAEVEQMWKAGDKVGQPGFFSAIANNKYISAPGRLYQAEEQWFKLAKYIHNRQKGLSITRSVDDAHKWLFDYTNVSPFVNFTRQTSHPFITFTAKAGPRILESWFKHPLRNAKYYLAYKYYEDYSKAKLGITDDDYNLVKKSLPEYMRSGTWMLLPERDKNDNLQFFNFSYILPWGDITATTDAVPVVGAGYIQDLLVPTNPFVAPLYEIALNKTVFGRRPIWKADENAVARSMQHLAATWSPPITPGVGYVAEGVRKDLILNRPNFFGERANRLQGLGSIFGIRTKAIDPLRQASFNASAARRDIKALQSRLRSLEMRFRNGVITRPERDIKKLDIELQINDLKIKFKDEIEPLAKRFKGE